MATTRMMTARHRRLRRQVSPKVEGALSLIEGSLLVGVVGTALAIFLPTFIREVHSSKVAEAPRMLEELAGHVAAYYSEAQPGPQGDRRGCLPAPAGPTPRLPSPDPQEVDFSDPRHDAPMNEEDVTDEVVEGEEEEAVEEVLPSHAVWEALAVSTHNLRYSYILLPVLSGCGHTTTEAAQFVIPAHGDLDGDGEFSTFEQAYRVVRGEAVPVGILQVQSRVE